MLERRELRPQLKGRLTKELAHSMTGCQFYPKPALRNSLVEPYLLTRGSILLACDAKGRLALPSDVVHGPAAKDIGAPPCLRLRRRSS